MVCLFCLLVSPRLFLYVIVLCTFACVERSARNKDNKPQGVSSFFRNYSEKDKGNVMGKTVAATQSGGGRATAVVNLAVIRRQWKAAIIVRRAGLLWSQRDFEWRWSVPLFKCLTVLEFSFILFDLCLLITFFNFIMNYVPIVTFWIFTYHKIWILSIMFCSIWSYWIIYFLACLEVSWRVVS